LGFGIGPRTNAACGALASFERRSSGVALSRPAYLRMTETIVSKPWGGPDRAQWQVFRCLFRVRPRDADGMRPWRIIRLFTCGGAASDGSLSVMDLPIAVRIDDFDAGEV